MQECTASCLHGFWRVSYYSNGQCRVLSRQSVIEQLGGTYLVKSEKRLPQLEGAACFIMYLTLFLNHVYAARGPHVVTQDATRRQDRVCRVSFQKYRWTSQTKLHPREIRVCAADERLSAHLPFPAKGLLGLQPSMQTCVRPSFAPRYGRATALETRRMDQGYLCHSAKLHSNPSRVANSNRHFDQTTASPKSWYTSMNERSGRPCP